MSICTESVDSFDRKEDKARNTHSESRSKQAKGLYGRLSSEQLVASSELLVTWSLEPDADVVGVYLQAIWPDAKAKGSVPTIIGML